MLTSLWENALSQDSFSIGPIKFDSEFAVIILFILAVLLFLFDINTFFNVQCCMLSFEIQLINGDTLYELILVLPIKILSIGEHEHLLNLVGKSTV